MNRRDFLSSITGALAAAATGLGLKCLPASDDLSCLGIQDRGYHDIEANKFYELNRFQMPGPVDPAWSAHQAAAQLIIAETLGMPASLLRGSSYSFADANLDNETFRKVIEQDFIKIYWKKWPLDLEQ